MLIKPRFAWEAGKERSVYEIVSEDGVMQTKDIFYIVQKLCIILDNQPEHEIAQGSGCIRPQQVIVRGSGSVRLTEANQPLPVRHPYLPPELERTDETAPAAQVYSLGMLMLFMATGQDKKSDLEIRIENQTLRTMIERCTAFDPQKRFGSVKEMAGLIRGDKRAVRRMLPILLTVACVSAVIGLTLHFYRQGTDKGEPAGKNSGYAAGYAYGYDKGFRDAPGIGIEAAPFDPGLGNLPGNITAAQGAFAVRSEDRVFYIHAESIYSLDPYSEEVQLLVKDASAKHLSYYEGWLYYCTDSKVMRLDPRTQKQEVFCETHTGLLYIVDGEFFLDTAGEDGYLYRINPGSGNLKQMNGMTDFHCLNITGKRLFYSAADENYHLYRCDLDGGNLKLLSSSGCESFSVYDGRIYTYAAGKDQDRDHSSGASSSFLVSMDLDGGNIKRFMERPAHSINVTQAGIFYVAGQNKTLEWMSPDGNTHYTILSSPTGPFNLAGMWLFYQNEADGGDLWRVRIDGSGNKKVLP